MANAQPEALSFPTDFPIKVLGRNDASFAPAVIAVVREHVPDFDPATVEVRASRAGNYLALTATVRATSRAQLDTLYRALTGHPAVKVVL